MPSRMEGPSKAGWEEFGPKPGMMTMTNNDVFKVTWQGGGGWGDPLDRDPDAVLQDVLVDAVSYDASRKIYGVVIENGTVDLPATEQDRRTRRAQRGTRGTARGDGAASGKVLARIRLEPSRRRGSGRDSCHLGRRSQACQRKHALARGCVERNGERRGPAFTG